MKTVLSEALILGMLVLVPSAFAKDEGGMAEGGTNVDKQTMEPKDFHDAKRAAFSPKDFEGHYASLDPVLSALDDRVPGLRARLEEALQKTWYFTRERFEPRNDRELKPVSQDALGVYWNIDEVKAMNPEQRRRAFFHELVRGMVMEHHGHMNVVDERISLSEKDQDRIVEPMTTLLFTADTLTEQQLARELAMLTQGTVTKRGTSTHFVTRAEVAKVYEDYQYVCRPGETPLSEESMKIALLRFSGDWVIDFYEKFALLPDPAGVQISMFKTNLGRALTPPRAKYGYHACSMIKAEAVDFMRKMSKAVAPNARIRGLEDAEEFLNRLNRSPGSLGPVSHRMGGKVISSAEQGAVRENSGLARSAR